MKLKVQFEFDGELPKELWWIAYADWDSEEFDITLEPEEGDLVLVITRMDPLTKAVDVMQLKTVCNGMRVIGSTPEENA